MQVCSGTRVGVPKGLLLLREAVDARDCGVNIVAAFMAAPPPRPALLLTLPTYGDAAASAHRSG
jgi:hypothetical protein